MLLLWRVFGLVLLAHLSVAQVVRCYTKFDVNTGSCEQLLGEVDEIDCCRNPYYGYSSSEGKCEYCHPASWSAWSPWGACTVSCLEGVQQRRRWCYGIGNCNDTEDLGNLQTRPCIEKPCCPATNNWNEWEPWQECSVTCKQGTRQRRRSCSNECGCEGPETMSEPCDTKQACPVNGGWGGWGTWGACSATCRTEGLEAPIKYRYRDCVAPAPSINPPGLPCPGSNQDKEFCNVPFCPVAGGWGPWGPLSACSVTCGVGLKVKSRECNNPTPKHQGANCVGDSRFSELCNTREQCPVHGSWGEWGPWEVCKRSGKNIVCSKYSAGTQLRRRDCLKSWDGNICPEDTLSVETRNCYNIHECNFKGNWSEWSEWSLCSHNCGDTAKKTRKRTCEPNLSDYVMLVGNKKELAYFYGKPKVACLKQKPSFIKEEAPCENMPECNDP